jgi:hypothetical protein
MLPLPELDGCQAELESWRKGLGVGVYRHRLLPSAVLQARQAHVHGLGQFYDLLIFQDWVRCQELVVQDPGVGLSWCIRDSTGSSAISRHLFSLKQNNSGPRNQVRQPHLFQWRCEE